LASEIIPRIIANKPSNELIKVWSAGCATGEEVYTLAILLIEALGVEQFKQRVKLYATDVAQAAIYHARQGRYSHSQIAEVPSALLARYFEPIDEDYIFRQNLRRPIIFTQHNLLQDAPMSKVDLLVCRNTLMYFNTEGQTRALVRFYFGLRDTGFLVLGTTETPGPYTDNALFTPVHRHHRLFVKQPNSCTPRLLIKAFRQRKHQSSTQAIPSAGPEAAHGHASCQIGKKPSIG
ncbi:MAG TPA: CheR family methyltransferase, partial [Candidatus Caenarcaniphilales bacterium]